MDIDFRAAAALQQEGKVEEAADAYRQVPADDPHYFKAQNNLGLIHEKRGQAADAEAAYRNALAAKEDSEILHYNLARVLHQAGRLIEAVASYQKAMELDPHWAEPVYNLAIAYHQQDRTATAEAFYRKALEMAPAMASAHRYLGDLLFETGRHGEALASYERALELDPQEPAGHFNLGKSLFHLGRIEEAEAAYRRSLQIHPQSNSAYTNLVDLLRRTGNVAGACDVVRQWKEAFPDNPIARHTWSSLTGEGVADRAEDSYVRQLFDEFADHFDATLAKLNYQAPSLVAAALFAALPPEAANLEILDAGCGTGLCGPVLRQRASRLTGVDLSRGMIEKADQRRVYDALIQEEITTYLRRSRETFDAIVAADTFNYFGALEELFAAAAGALRPNGRLAFTLERHEAPEHRPWRLHPHGRYSHAETYFRQALEGAAFQLESLAVADLRSEGCRPVAGWLATARRRSELRYSSPSGTGELPG